MIFLQIRIVLVSRICSHELFRNWVAYKLFSCALIVMLSSYNWSHCLRHSRVSWNVKRRLHTIASHKQYSLRYNNGNAMNIRPSPCLILLVISAAFNFCHLQLFSLEHFYSKLLVNSSGAQFRNTGNNSTLIIFSLTL